MEANEKELIELEDHAKELVEAVRKITEATGAYLIMQTGSDGQLGVQMFRDRFEAMFGPGIRIERSGCEDYPAEEAVTIAGVRFYALISKENIEGGQTND